MPKSVRAHCQFGRFHDVEVEDDVTAYLEYENGATGVFVGSTGEAPGVNRFEVIGDAGSLVFDGSQLSLAQNTPSTAMFNRTTKQMFGMPETVTDLLAIDRKVNQHAVLMQNFVNAIRDNEPLIAPLTEGLRSLSIANAMLLSTWKEQTIEFPIDAGEYQRHLQTKIDRSSLRVKADVEAEINMDSSYR
jgi:predicted dehydrogenase